MIIDYYYGDYYHYKINFSSNINEVIRPVLNKIFTIRFDKYKKEIFFINVTLKLI